MVHPPQLFSKNQSAIFTLWFCPTLQWQYVNTHLLLVFSARTSRLTFYKVSVLLNYDIYASTQKFNIITVILQDSDLTIIYHDLCPLRHAKYTNNNQLQWMNPAEHKDSLANHLFCTRPATIPPSGHNTPYDTVNHIFNIAIKCSVQFSKWNFLNFSPSPHSIFVQGTILVTSLLCSLHLISDIAFHGLGTLCVSKLCHHCIWVASH